MTQRWRSMPRATASGIPGTAASRPAASHCQRVRALRWLFQQSRLHCMELSCAGLRRSLAGMTQRWRSMPRATASGIPGTAASRPAASHCQRVRALRWQFQQSRLHSMELSCAGLRRSLAGMTQRWRSMPRATASGIPGTAAERPPAGLQHPIASVSEPSDGNSSNQDCTAWN